jgi:hypothetical protein
LRWKEAVEEVHGADFELGLAHNKDDTKQDTSDEPRDKDDDKSSIPEPADDKDEPSKDM